MKDTARCLICRLALVALTLTLLSPLFAMAQADPPGRVGRVADLQGGVSMFDTEQGQWEPAVRNRPLTQGDRLSTDTSGRAEMRIGSTTLRLAAGSELEVMRLDDERVVLLLHNGSLALRVRSADVARETEIVTAEARLQPQRAGHFRIDRVDDSTFASSWRGELRMLAPVGALRADEAFVIDNGRRAEIWREGRAGNLRHGWSQANDDAFASWAQREDQRDDQRTASNRYVSPEMTGAEDLDRNGRWEQHPEYGAVWVPQAVQPDWAPYRYGRWDWVQPWGWTWVDDAPWGFAPFHYGRWVSWGGRWCWSPGSYVARPVYSPALVAWVGGAGLGASIRIGGSSAPTVGWLPLAPRDVYVPGYRHSGDYRDRVNHQPPGRRGRPPEQVPTGPVIYGNQGVPGAVTVVPRDVLVQRQPVSRAVIDTRGDGRNDGRSDAGRRGWADAAPRPVAAPAAPGRTADSVASPAADARSPNDEVWRGGGRLPGERERSPLPRTGGAPAIGAAPAVGLLPATPAAPAVVTMPAAVGVAPPPRSALGGVAETAAPQRPPRDNERQRWPDDRQRQRESQPGEPQRRERGVAPAGAATDVRQQRDPRPANVVQPQPVQPQPSPPQPVQPSVTLPAVQQRPAPAVAAPREVPLPAPAVVVPRPATAAPQPTPAVVVRPPEQPQPQRPADDTRVRTPESRANMRDREQVR